MTMLAGANASFDLSGRVAIITGGAGLLGVQHGEAIAELGGIPVLVDLDEDRARYEAEKMAKAYAVAAQGMATDITQPEQVAALKDRVLDRLGRVDILINNAANNPKMENKDDAISHWSRLEHFPMEVWQQDFSVGLTGAFLCSQQFGTEMARVGRGVIINMTSDLGLIAPDQRLYQQPGLADDKQPVKPVTYSVVKAGLIGLTRYLATYWADRGVRCNALAPGGVFNGQPEDFVDRLASRIPMGRMACHTEYRAAIQFLSSDASSYMTGAVLSMDGGRTCW